MVDVEPEQSRVAAPIACVAASASGVLGALAFPSTNLHLLIWIAFVPLLVAIRGQSLGTRFLLGVITGLVGFAIAWPWIWSSIADYFALSRSAAAVFFAAILFWQSLQLALFCAFAGINRASIATTSPFAWVVAEWIFPKLFPWQLGLALEPHLPFVQLAEIGGTGLLSFVVILANVLFASALTSGRRTRPAWLGSAVALPLLLHSYGELRIAQIERADRLLPQWSVGVIQANVAPRHHPDRAAIESGFVAHGELSARMVRQQSASGFDLVVWPESALRVDLTRDSEMFHRVANLARDLRVLLLVGAGGRDDRNNPTSSMFLFSPSGDAVGGYNKLYPFPFAEHLPPGFGFLRNFLPVDQIVPGSPSPVLVLPRTRAAPSICYEATYPGFFSPAVMDGAEFAINLTNDAWFGNSSGPHHHLQAAVVRAVESRRWMIRAANTGISAIIGASGRVVTATDLFVPATLGAQVALRRDQSLYARFGDWFPWTCLIGLVGMFVAGCRRPG